MRHISIGWVQLPWNQGMSRMAEMQDTELIKSAQGGDSHAFEALVNSYYEVMFKMAFKWCGNRDDAEEITQDACIKLARGIGSYKFNSAFTSWLYVLVINTAKDFYKKQSRRPAESEAHPGYQKAATEGNSEERLYAQQVWAQVRQLPEGERAALILVMNDGLTHKEAAKLLGVKESTVSWRVHEARKKLISIFGKEQAHG